jgi:alkylation response protein AidB-like acyl-CoA dehydrogenase
MDFGLSEEQQLFCDSLRRYLEESLPVARVRQLMEGEAAHDPAVWSGLAELGAAGVIVPEELGGSGLSLLDAALVAHELARAAAPAPFLSTSVMAPVAFLTTGTPEQRREWLPRIATGDVCFGVAIGEVVARREDAGVALRDGRLHGKAYFALDAGAADPFLVAAGTKSLHLVPRSAEGLAISGLATVDQTRRVAKLELHGVEPAETLGGPRGSATAIARMLDAGRIALAADALGACDRMLEMAVGYAKERRQFGRVIGSFQAVKHMCAEMVAEIEPARSLLWYAAHAFDHIPEEARLVATLTKAHLSEVATEVAKTSTEVHGGIGFTHEYDLHLWFKRIGLDRQLLGGPEQLRAEAAQVQGWERDPSARPQDIESSRL